MKIQSILLWVQENKLSEKFYKKLGFEVVQSNDRLSTVNLQGFEIMLVSMRDEAPFSKDALSGDKGKGLYIYVRVDDVDVAYGDLVQKGIQPATEPKTWEWGNREFIVKDPDGYKLCFWQPIKQ